jgi:membrane protein
VRDHNWIWRVGIDAVRRFNRNDGWAMAGYVAYTGLLSIFPFLIFAATLTGILVGTGRSDEIIEALFKIAPEHVALTLEPVVTEVLNKQSSEILTLSGVFAVYAASNGINAIRVAFDRAYDTSEQRGYLHNRAVAVLMVFVGAVVATILGVSILLSPLLLRLAQDILHFPIPAFASYITYAFGMVVFMGFTLSMHRILPGWDAPPERLWPGVLITALLWVLVAGGYTIYLSYTPTYTLIYGTLSGVIITLMFFYLTGSTIILGAEVNAALNELDKQPAARRRD